MRTRPSSPASRRRARCWSRSSPWWSSPVGWATARRTPRGPGRARRRGTRGTGAAARRRGRGRRWRRGWGRSRSAPGRPGRASPPPPPSGGGGFAPPTGPEAAPDSGGPALPFGVVGGTIIAAEGASAFDDLIDGGRVKDLTAPEDRTGGYPAVAIPARDYLRAMRVRGLMCRAYDDFLKPYDAVATPTRATVASPLDKAFRDAYPDVKGGVSLIGSSNVVGVPGISLPNGFGLAGLPTALSFVTRAFDEGKLVRLARIYQARTDWHTRRPPVP